MSRSMLRRPTPGTWTPGKSVLIATTLVALALAFAGTAGAQLADPGFWCPDGPVYATAVSGTTLYFGGGFGYVGPNNGSFVAVDAATGTPRAGWPRVDGGVKCAVSDGAGGWYIGGSFAHVGGLPRAGLAYLHADGAVDGWNPGTDGRVDVLVPSGGTLYVGGQFAHVGGQPHANLAAVDLASGALAAWNPSPNGEVVALRVNGATMYAAGWFTSVGSKARNYIAAINTISGLATSWDPGADNAVTSMVVSGTSVYACGYFYNVGGQARSHVAALDMTTGLATSWNPAANGSPYADALRTLGFAKDYRGMSLWKR